MKKLFVLALAFGSIAAFTSCKSSESAYRKAYEKAKAQENSQQTPRQQNTTTVTVVPTTPVVIDTTKKVVVAAAPATAPKEDNSDVRTIAGGVTVVNGSGLKAYSVVVGSYSVQANAEGRQSQLKQQGFDAQVVKSNETINGITGWYRVVASTFDTKEQAVNSRNTLRATYKDAWLLYNK